MLKCDLSFLTRCLIHSLNIQYHIKSFVVMRNKSSQTVEIEAIFNKFTIHLRSVS